MQVLFPASEPHLDTVAASSRQPGMKWLVYISNQMGNKSKSSTLAHRAT
jgi:hypothetical protein